MKTHHHTPSFLFKAAFTAAVFFGAVVSVVAFTEPSSAPPYGDVPAPLNVGSTYQSKAGSIGVGTYSNDGLYSFGYVYGLASLGTAGFVQAGTYVVAQQVISPQYCFGTALSPTSCITSWPSGGTTYTDTDTLDSVTARGATTLNNITVGTSAALPSGWGGGVNTWDVVAHGSVAAGQYCFAGGTNCITAWPRRTCAYNEVMAGIDSSGNVLCRYAPFTWKASLGCPTGYIQYGSSFAISTGGGYTSELMVMCGASGTH